MDPNIISCFFFWVGRGCTSYLNQSFGEDFVWRNHHSHFVSNLNIWSLCLICAKIQTPHILLGIVIPHLIGNLYCKWAYKSPLLGWWPPPTTGNKLEFRSYRFTQTFPSTNYPLSFKFLKYSVACQFSAAFISYPKKIPKDSRCGCEGNFVVRPQRHNLNHPAENGGSVLHGELITWNDIECFTSCITLR